MTRGDRHGRIDNQHAPQWPLPHAHTTHHQPQPHTRASDGPTRHRNHAATARKPGMPITSAMGRTVSPAPRERVCADPQSAPS